MLRITVWGAAVWIMSVCVASAQLQTFMAEGNLKPSQDLGCVGAEAAQPDITAADFMLASQNCLNELNFDFAVESFILMQVFGVFDAQRVADISAHQGVAVMGQTIAQSLDASKSRAFEAAVQQFGGEGSKRHTKLCGRLQDIGPPTYHPDYMIQHGQEYFLYPDDDPIVENFDPDASWASVLTNFLKCSVG
ncbi:MAG: hypothetical protein OXQ92_11790 [Boseongicola sp.]|nr:hypothetical protein [Boseongicola sp.]MDD9977254.1 hypothetical protein [Boseongicola sp.]